MYFSTLLIKWLAESQEVFQCSIFLSGENNYVQQSLSSLYALPRTYNNHWLIV